MPTGIGDELCWFCAQHDASGVDLSGNGNNATIGSAVSTSAPPTDPNNTTDITWTAADGGGSTRAVNMSSAMAAVRTASLAAGKYSISFWMLPSSTYNRRTFGTYQTTTRLRAGRASEGSIYAGLSTNGSSFYAVVVPSKSTTRMHHFVLTWDDNNEAKGYVDGVLVTTDSVSTYSAGNTGGAFNYPDSPPYGGGYIDDVRAFDRILTQAEITHLATSRGIEGNPYTYSGLGDEKLWLCPSLDDSADDISGNSNHGTYNGGMGTVADTSNGGTRAYRFDGLNDYVDFGDILDTEVWTAGDFAISGWIKTNGLNTVQVLNKYHNISGNRQFHFRVIYSGGNLKLNAYIHTTLNNAEYRFWEGSTNLNANTWYHVALNYDASASSNDRASCFINGSSETMTVTQSSGTLSTIPDGSASLAIGARVAGASASNFTTGYSDDIRIFDRALTTSEITALASKRGYESSTGIRRINFSGGFQQLTGGFSG